MVKKIILFASLLPFCVFADISDKMNNFFDNATVSNFTSAKAIHSQEASYLSGGSADIKTNVSNMQIARVQVPSLNAGCSGINLYTGGFSYISADELGTFGKNILTAGGPIALDMALQTWAPSLEKIKNQYQSYAQAINSFNMSSCQAAELGVSYVADSLSSAKTMQHTCKVLATQNNKFSSWLESRESCSSATDIANEAQQAKNNKESSLVAPNRNITWYILNHPTMIDSDVAQYIISLVGTVSYQNTTRSYYPSLFTTVDSPILKAYLEGGDVIQYQCSSTSSADGSSNSNAGCVQMNTVEKNIPADKSLSAKIQKVLDVVKNNIKNGQALNDSQTKMLSTFGNIPIITSIRTDMELGRSTDTHLYAKYLATKILENYISNLVQQLNVSIASNQSGGKDVANIESKAQQVMSALEKQSKDSLTAINLQQQMQIAEAEKLKQQNNVNNIAAKQ